MKALIPMLLMFSFAANGNESEVRAKHRAYLQCRAECGKTKNKQSCIASCNKRYGVIDR